MLRVHFFSVVILAAGLAGCGNGSSGPNTSKGGGGGGGGTVPVVAPITMNVTSGQTATANILVASPAATTPPNAKLLGVAPITATTISAFNTGATIQRNSVDRVVLFGPGLSGSMQVSINGPTTNDITISNVQTVTATDGTPGISFTATVPTAAAVGARTVVLRSTQDDITTFTGGLEVQ